MNYKPSECMTENHVRVIYISGISFSNKCTGYFISYEVAPCNKWCIDCKYICSQNRKHPIVLASYICAVLTSSGNDWVGVKYFCTVCFV